VTIYQNVYEQGTLGRLQLLGKVLSTLHTAHDGKVAALRVTREMFHETDTREEDTDGMINYTLSIKGVQVGLMFTELQDGVKVSFRSKGDIAVNKLAQEFGGNGHMNAAGARVTGAKVHELAELVIARSHAYIR
jgi:phosphoesterase RecJ-like protein